MREGEKISEKNEFPFNNFYTPFLYSYMSYAYFTLVKLKAPRGRFLRRGEIFLNK
jgi:hypothetical protein